MEFAEVLSRRRMVRHYDDRPINPEVVERVVNAGLRAPSAGFSQGYAVLLLTDAEGVALPCQRDTEGYLRVRGASAVQRYFGETQPAVDAQGWFDTGDLARKDEAGYIRISGRSKDVIIRGGENIPVFEIESLLYRHPAVAQVAIVAYPDERLGERACAVVVPRPGQSIDLPEVVRFLKEQKVAVQYLPERLMVRESMPATPSGKIQKFRLRELVAAG